MHLDQDGALVVADGDVIRSLAIGQGPDALHAVVQRRLQAVCGGVPNSQRSYQ